MAIALAGGFLWAASSRYFWHQQLYAHWLTYRTSAKTVDSTIGLSRYSVVIDGKTVEASLHNLSGITYDYDHDRLLAITNNTPMELLVLSKAGDIQARYPLVGFEDTEGLAYLGNGRLVIVDEEQQQLDVLNIPQEVRPIHVEEAQYIAVQINASHSNKGFEGVTYDPASDRLFAIKERDPRAMYEVTGLLKALDAQGVRITVRDLTPWIARSVFARDLSDGYYDPASGHLLVLSDQSRNITELDADGHFVSIRSLRAAFSDLHKDAPQPEGITMDTAGNLYIVSEPNLFYAFQKRQ